MPPKAAHTLCLLLCNMALTLAIQAQATVFDSIRVAHQLAGMSVVTRCGGAISTDHHSGLRNVSRKLPVNGETTFRIASISKAIVALAGAKLAEQGTVDLDTPIGNYLEDPPSHPGHPEVALTLRHLFTHTSGIRDGEGYAEFLTATYAGIPNVPPLASVLAQDGPFHTADMWGPAPPGGWFQYANLNYGVAATVLEAASGMRFDQLMNALLLAPYGIDGGFQVQDLEDVGDLAVLYRQVDSAWVPQADDFNGQMPNSADWSGYMPGLNAVGFAPQGGLRISARDLTRLAHLWSTGSAPDATGVPMTFIAPSTLADFHAIQWTMDTEAPNGDNHYGLFNQWSSGLHLAASGYGEDMVIPDVPVAPFMGHPGEAYGLVSDAYAAPGGGWNFAFITNGKWDGYAPGPSSAFYAVEQDVFSALREDLLQCLASSVPAAGPLELSVIGWPRVGDTLVQLRCADLEGPLEFELFDAAGHTIAAGKVDSGESGLLALQVSPLTGGMLFGLLSSRSSNRAGRFILLVTG